MALGDALRSAAASLNTVADAIDAFAADIEAKIDSLISDEKVEPAPVPASPEPVPAEVPAPESLAVPPVSTVDNPIETAAPLADTPGEIVAGLTIDTETDNSHA